MDFLHKLIDTLVHLSPESLNELALLMGPWLYVAMFAIIFAETGFVVTPFLPGDSLLFGLGAVAGGERSPINLSLMAVLLVIAAVAGDAVNYAIGAWLGPKVFSREDSKLLNRKHLLRAHEFYERHGGKTIILARFVPIIRTFAPFVAGVGRMGYARFALYNVTGGVVWILLFLLGGWRFGKLPFVEKQFHWVIAAIIAISLIPPIWELIRARKAERRGESAVLEATTIGEDPSRP
jgi:membrane-associated protein